jgi:hypothetical protein
MMSAASPSASSVAPQYAHFILTRLRPAYTPAVQPRSRPTIAAMIGAIGKQAGRLLLRAPYAAAATPPSAGKRNASISSRSSWRAATWPMENATPSVSPDTSSVVRPLRNSSR